MDTSFLVMDEGGSEETKLASLTALVIPLAASFQLRDELTSFAASLEPLPPSHLSLNPPELHGSSMLRGVSWATDDTRILVFEKIIELVNRLKIKIVRVAYVRASVGTMIETDPKLYGLCLFSVLAMIQPILAVSFLLPLMDGLDEQIARFVAGQIRSLHLIRNNPRVAESISLNNTENLGDAFFGSSKYSSLVQATDCIGYILHVQDFERTGRKVSPYKARLLEVASKLQPHLLRSEVITVKDVTPKRDTP